MSTGSPFTEICFTCEEEEVFVYKVRKNKRHLYLQYLFELGYDTGVSKNNSKRGYRAVKMPWNISRDMSVKH